MFGLYDGVILGSRLLIPCIAIARRVQKVECYVDVPLDARGSSSLHGHLQFSFVLLQLASPTSKTRAMKDDNSQNAYFRASTADCDVIQVQRLDTVL